MTTVTIKKPLVLKVRDPDEELVAAVIELDGDSIDMWLKRLVTAATMRSDDKMWPGLLCLTFEDCAPTFVRSLGDTLESDKLTDDLFEEEVILLPKPLVIEDEVRLEYCNQDVDGTYIHWEAAEKHSLVSFETVAIPLEQLKGFR